MKQIRYYFKIVQSAKFIMDQINTTNVNKQSFFFAFCHIIIEKMLFLIPFVSGKKLSITIDGMKHRLTS